MLELKKADKNDLPVILSIVEDGIISLKKQGLPQWQNGYGPQENQLLADIEKQESYLLMVDGEIYGTAALVSGVDDVYTAIKDGQWSGNDSEYRSIHRFALAAKATGKGFAKRFLRLLAESAQESGCNDIRIDTHPENIKMQKAILGAGFTYRGMVEFPIPDGKRKAYQIIMP